MIKINQVSYAYAKKQVLNNISFEIPRGEITCLVGLNGSGKTTLMNLIMRLLPWQSGDITIDGKVICPDSLDRLSYVPDQIIVLNSMTVQESLAMMQRYYSTYNPRRASELLEFFRLKREDKIGSLSKGNVAKMNLLLGLTLDTDYLIMDEPFSGIDALAREQILQVFTSNLMEQRGVLISTHEVNEIESLIDNVVILKDGEIVENFKAEERREEQGQSILDVMREVN
ncbi:ABC transporter ATP-binding protein [Ignavigranum ruoffiae]|uniref:ABC-2 type transport system ATP-binding protein n=1 Tax=Ignavigranum ruoffiae TaxID=89093 RepID=A0A1H9A2X5_9LACT|nr:ABC transporter ATP-binding protein [Ignavigranum ruoffiae]SEP71019.1 ABC-2 type transport system ATP-binding protein [Ignavigranum ruoffiae]